MILSKLRKDRECKKDEGNVNNPNYDNCNYFLIKDYVIGKCYAVNLDVANMLFRGKSSVSGFYTDSDCSYKDLQQICIYLEEYCKDSGLMIVRNEKLFYSNKILNDYLKKRIDEFYKEEKTCGLEQMQIRAKNNAEKDDCRSIRIIGVYKTFKEMEEDYIKLSAKVKSDFDGKWVDDKDLVFFTDNLKKVPQDFKGKVVLGKNVTPTYKNNNTKFKDLLDVENWEKKRQDREEILK